MSSSQRKSLENESHCLTGWGEMVKEPILDDIKINSKKHNGGSDVMQKHYQNLLIYNVADSMISGNIRMIGIIPIILKKYYDENQYWFDFMRGAIFQTQSEEKPKQNSSKSIKQTTYARVDDIYKSLYPRDYFDKNQWVLPFLEGKRITNSEFDKMRNSGFANWDKDSTGQPYSITLSTPEKRGKIEEWCKMNCKHRFYINSNKRIYFQYADDYLIAKLRF